MKISTPRCTMRISIVLICMMISLFSNPFYAQNADGDAAIDRVDLDDDNDGILDSVECIGVVVGTAVEGPNLVLNSNFDDGYANWTSDFNRGRGNQNGPPATNGTCADQGWVAISPYQSSNGICNPYYSYSGGVLDGSVLITDANQTGDNVYYTGALIAGDQAFPLTPQQDDFCLASYMPFTDGTPGSAGNLNNTLYIDPNDNANEGYWKQTIPNILAGTVYRFRCFIYIVEQDPELAFIINGGVVFNSAVNTAGVGVWQEVTFDWNSGAVSGNVAIEIANTQGGCFGNDIRLDDITFAQLVPDSDGDGIADCLDTDSDNDGCPDAIEAAGGFGAGDLDSDDSLGDVIGATPGVDLGVPIPAGTGQPTTANVTTYGPDSDGDGISDACDAVFNDIDGDGLGDGVDLDDDNDGITDDTECIRTLTAINGTGGNYTLEFGDIGSIGLQAPNSDTPAWLPANASAAIFDNTTEFLIQNSTGGLAGFNRWYNNTTTILGAAGVDFDLTFPANRVTEFFLHINSLDQFRITFDDAENPNVGWELVNSNSETNNTAADVNDFNIGDADQVDKDNSAAEEIIDGPNGLSADFTLRFFPINGTTHLSTINLTHIDQPGRPVAGEGWQISAEAIWDNDGDGVSNCLDLDSDNDGIYDVVEAGGTPSGAVGQEGRAEDDNNNTDNMASAGIPTSAAGGLTPTDTGSDGSLDYLTLDSDADGCSDANEAYGSLTADGGDTGVYGPDGTLTVNGNGLVTSGAPVATYADPVDGDSVGGLDYQQTGGPDSDGDGFSDACDSVFNDVDGDGVGDAVDLDDDNDGILDTTELNCSPGFIPVNSPGLALNTDFSGNIPAELSGMIAYDGASIDVEYVIQGSTTWSSGVRVLNNGSLGPDGDYINFQPANTDFPNGDVAVYTLSFSQPVYNLEFKWGGLDNLDRIDIQASNGATAVGVSIADINIGAANISILGNSVVSSAGGANAPNNSVQYRMLGAVDQVVLTVGKNNGDAGNVTMQLYEMSYCLDLDTDNDGISDYLDIDADNDGIYDVVEAGGADANDDGRADDDDNNTDNIASNGVPTSAGVGLSPTDTGSNGSLDYLTLDSDGDGCSDANEAYADANADGSDGGIYNPGNTAAEPLSVGAGTITSDGAVVAATYADPVNGDSAGGLDYQQIGGPDADGDGIPDACDLVFDDADGDGVGDAVDLDDDNDGILDTNDCELSAPSGGAVSLYANVLEPFSYTPTVTLNGNSTTSSLTLPDGLVNATITHSGTPVESIDTNAGRPAGVFLDVQSNPGDDGFRGVNSGGSYTLTYTFDRPVNVFFFDAETSVNGENYSATTDGGVFRILDSQNLANASITGLGTQSITVTSTNAAIADAPVVLFISEDVTNLTFNVTQLPGGKTGLGVGAFKFLCLDTDDDGIPNSLDLDSDNDGIYDVVEAGGTDVNDDGRADDDDNNTDNTASNGIPTSAGGGLTPTDTGSDGSLDYITLDSDGDGCSDANEAYADSNADGADGGIYNPGNAAAEPLSVGAGTIDSDGAVVAASYTDPVDGDSAGGLDYQQIGGPDADGDGISDACDLIFNDVDGDGVGDGFDLDDDNDGILDTVESGGLDPLTDADGDGVPLYLDDDDDPLTGGAIGNVDGLVQPGFDTDGDNVANHLDLDSDNDGIYDVVEAGGTDTNDDGRSDDDDNNTDNTATNGVPTSAAGGLTPTDTGSDGSLDYLTLDSDGDGCSDANEAYASSTADGGDTGVYGPDGTLSVDGNGLVTSGAPAASYADPADGDSTGGLDYQQIGGPDADSDGISDACDLIFNDIDGDGVADAVDLDNDNDGILDTTECSVEYVDFSGATVSGTAGPVETITGISFVSLNATADLTITENGGDLTGLSVGGPSGVFNASEHTPMSGSAIQFINTAVDHSNTVGNNIDFVLTFNRPVFEVVFQFRNVARSGYEFTGAQHTEELVSSNAAMSYNVGTRELENTAAFPPEVSGSGSIRIIATSPAGMTQIEWSLIENVANTNAVGSNLLTFSADCDIDGDGVPNRLDLDADNDGIYDVVEAGGTDTNDDGRADDDDNNADNTASNGVPTSAAGGLTPTDTGSDGSLDYLTLDSDGDGCSDANEAYASSTADGGDTGVYGPDGTLSVDGNGLVTSGTPAATYADPLDGDSAGGLDYQQIGGPDADGDGISDACDLIFNDVDGDGVGDALDLDDDNDGILDTVESGGLDPLTDADGDGVPLYLDDDDDPLTGGAIGNVDGLVESGFDTDGDNVANHLDLDADNDGIYDVVEAGGTDTNDDGRADDDDNNADNTASTGVPTSAAGGLTPTDTGSDGSLDYLTLDSDGDGCSDANEAYASSTADGGDTGVYGPDGGLTVNGNGLVTSGAPAATYADPLDSDSAGGLDYQQIGGPDADGDGISDACDLIFNDVDGDGVGDALDLDDDNDGILDTVESGGLDPLTDADGDGVPLYLDDDDDPLTGGAIGNVDGLVESGFDTDGDNVANHLDLDADNDGIYDVVEAGGVDTNDDGRADDDDNNADNTASNGVPTSAAGGLTPTDTGSDGSLDYLTLDSDGDGCSDANEAYASSTADGGDTGVYGPDGTLSVDGNGLVTSGAPAATYADPLDSDSAGGLDYQQIGGPDADGDGISDACDLIFNDVDGDGVGDALDLDDDNDGILDTVESGGLDPLTDADGDGVPLYLDDDDDPLTGGAIGNVDGLVESGFDADGDNVANHLDLDSDNDGLYDIVETGNSTLDPDGDGAANGSVGMNGIPDVAEDGGVDGAGVSSTPINTDNNLNDGSDYLDIDADDDGIPDNVEAQPTAGYVVPSGDDNDNDGVDDAYDPVCNLADLTDPANGNTDECAAAGFVAGTNLTPEDTDSDLTPDYIDTDSDNDGASDLFEAGQVFMSGLATDIDGDGLLDIFDNSDDSGTAPDVNDNLNTGAINTDNVDDTNLAEVDFRSILDADNDGVADSVDLDDDNDGITDVLECPMEDAAFLDFTGQPNVASGVNLYNVSTINNEMTFRVEYVAANSTLNYRAQNFTSNSGSVVDSQSPAALDEINMGQILNREINFIRESLDQDILYLVNLDTRDSAVIIITAFDESNNPIDLSSTSVIGVGGDGTTVPNWNGSTGTLTTSGSSDNFNSNPVYINLSGLNIYRINYRVNTLFSDGAGVSLGTRVACDTDGDNVANHLDLDADNDGIYDVVEAGGVDTNDDGRADDDNNNTDNIASNGVPTSAGGGLTPTDTGSDGSLDYLTLDSDGDGCSDANEAYASSTADGGDTGLYGPDVGLTVDGNGLVTSGAPVASYADPADGDSAGGLDFQQTGGPDADGDGISDACDLVFNDVDGDGVGDGFDLDDDNDGILDTVESGGLDPLTDADGDGVPLYLDDDDDPLTGGAIGNVDGLVESGFDTDGDNVANHLDLDADNDGIPDNIEAQSTGGYIVPAVTTMAEYIANNGVNNAYLTTNGGGPGLDPVNTDGPIDAIPDYLDLDSDEDSVLDIEENGDTDNAIIVFADDDGDGIDNLFDTVDNTITWDVNDATTTGDVANLQTVYGDFDNDAAPTPVPLDSDLSFRDNCQIIVGVIAADQTICSGADPIAFTVTTATSIDAGAITYQWQSSTTSASAGFANISSATSDTYDSPALTQDTWFKRIDTNTLNGNTCSVETNVVAVMVNNITAGVIAADETICSGADPIAFTETTATVADGTITYQWQSSTTGATGPFADIPTAIASTYDSPALSQDTWFQRVDISTLNGEVCTATTNVIAVIVNDITAGVIAADQMIVSAQDPAAFTEVTPTVADGTITYQWQSSTDGPTGPFVDISGATSAVYDSPALTQDTWFRRIDTSTLNGQACTDITNVLSIILDSDGDGISDSVDLDDDNDGITDAEELNGNANLDTDGDGIIDSLDLDSDGDGVNDVFESGHGQLDMDGDGRLEGPFGADGIPDVVQNDPDGGAVNYIVQDTDGDGIDDFQDIDDDGDNILTADENPNPDNDGDPDTGLTQDSDMDGIYDYLDMDDDNDGVNTVYEDYDGDDDPLNQDTDGDGIPDYLDTDDDGDGVDTQFEGVDPDGDGNPNTGDTQDTDCAIDNNCDGIPDYLDTDDDGDGLLTEDENPDPNGDGNPDDALDTDGNGVPDYLQPNNTSAEEGEDGITVFTGITPNGDGINDVFIIEGISNLENTVKIFNRWGVIVYEAKSYGRDDNFFRGISNGRSTIEETDLLPVGTYYYVLEYTLESGEAKSRAGYLYINR